MAKSKRQDRRAKYTSTKDTIKKSQQGFALTTLKLPKEVSLFSFNQEKRFRIDVVPYVVGKGNPNADEGEWHWERTYYVHDNIGPENKRYCCLWKNFEKKCPICKAGGDAAKVKRRQIMLVRDYDDLDKGVQVFEGSYYNGFGELLITKLEASDDDSPNHDFFHLDSGSKLTVKCKPRGAGYKGFEPVNIEMELRKKPLPESILEDAPCLDDLLAELTYKELEKIFTQGDDGEGDEDEDAEDSEDSEEDEDENPRAKTGGRGGKKKGSDDDEPEDDDDGDSEDDEEEPEDEEDDEEDDEEEDGDSEEDSDDEDLDDDSDDDEEDSEEEEDEKPKRGAKKPPVKKAPPKGRGRR